MKCLLYCVRQQIVKQLVYMELILEPTLFYLPIISKKKKTESKINVLLNVKDAGWTVRERT